MAGYYITAILGQYWSWLRTNGGIPLGTPEYCTNRTRMAPASLYLPTLIALRVNALQWRLQPSHFNSSIQAPVHSATTSRGFLTGYVLQAPHDQLVMLSFTISPINGLFSIFMLPSQSRNFSIFSSAEISSGSAMAPSTLNERLVQWDGALRLNQARSSSKVAV